MEKSEQVRKVKLEGAEGGRELVVGACISRDGMDEEGNPTREYLLVRRADEGPWFFPGGKVQHGEDTRTALRREIEQETGLRAHIDYLDRFEEYSLDAYESEGKEYVIENLTIPTDSLKREPEVQQTDRIQKIMWTADPLKYELTPQVRAVFEAKMGIIKPLGRKKTKDVDPPDKPPIGSIEGPDRSFS